MRFQCTLIQDKAITWVHFRVLGHFVLPPHLEQGNRVSTATQHLNATIAHTLKGSSPPLPPSPPHVSASPASLGCACDCARARMRIRMVVVTPCTHYCTEHEVRLDFMVSSGSDASKAPHTLHCTGMSPSECLQHCMFSGKGTIFWVVSIFLPSFVPKISSLLSDQHMHTHARTHARMHAQLHTYTHTDAIQLTLRKSFGCNFT